MSLEALTATERAQLVALKLRYAYDDPVAGDAPITVSDLVDGKIVERTATFDESWAPVARELRNLPAEPEDSADGAPAQADGSGPDWTSNPS